MSQYIKVIMEDGAELYIEAVDAEKHAQRYMEREGEGYGHGHVPAMSVEKAREKVVQATEFFGQVLPTATGFAKGVAEQIRKDIPSDEMELEFSIALTAEAKAAICSGGAATSFKVTLKWKKEETKTEQQN